MQETPGLVSGGRGASFRLMRLPFLFIPLLALSPVAAWAGTQPQAEAARQEYDLGVKLWAAKMKIATTTEERAAAQADRPDLTRAGKKMWAIIQPNLHEEWALEPAAWLVKMSPSMTIPGENGARKPAMAEAVTAIRTAVEKYHVKSKKLAPFCLALVSANDPAALGLLHRIETENPDPEVQGVAALAQAMLMKSLGDDAQAVSRRLTLLKKAIINSADTVVDGVPISKPAGDELYIILHLSKGRPAPEITGVGSGGEPMSLTSYKGKVVVLLFWTSESEDSQTVADMAHKMKERFAGKPFEVVGVNADSTAALRKMQADGQVRWPNFSDPEKKIAVDYRVGFWPLAYVLDSHLNIQYVGALGSFVELTAAALLEQS
jgi:peroxiredoxin